MHYSRNNQSPSDYQTLMSICNKFEFSLHRQKELIDQLQRQQITFIDSLARFFSTLRKHLLLKMENSDYS